MSSEKVTAESVRNRRSVRNLIVNRRFQFRYVLMVALSGLSLAALYSWIFYSYTHENYSTLVDLAPMTDEVKAQLYRELWQITLLLGLGSFGFVIVSSFIALVFSHRVAGPLYHFRKIFEEIRSGRTDLRIKLRPDDEFQDVAKSCNEMLDALTKKDV
ncbi:MAG: hypothetical protein A2X94_10070 [Bdellovibrionales bacterium GWB1_55_8]|nr:MAG: hypothetical protein A2X94_10070 [Bdellovibrionales bacterium GWB1_55_8]